MLAVDEFDEWDLGSSDVVEFCKDFGILSELSVNLVVGLLFLVARKRLDYDGNVDIRLW